jgi:hypothetical protein
MNKLKKLWWVGALALVAGCDPYDDEDKGDPQVLSVVATITALAAGEYHADDAIVDENAADGWALAAVPAGHTVFQVKVNKPLDGASVQSTPTSCVPASGVNLTVNGAADATWFTCYNPGSGTQAESSSVVVYKGSDVVSGVGGSGYFNEATITPGTYAIAFTVRDRQGHSLPVSFSATVVAAPVAAP